MAGKRYCFPECKFFRCGKRAITHRRDNTWCRWTDEVCNVAKCSFAACGKRRLLPNGICGDTVKRKTVEKKPEEEPTTAIKLRGKALRRIGDKEIF